MPEKMKNGRLTSISLIFRNIKFNKYKTRIVEAALARLLPGKSVDDKDFFRLMVCVSELLDNATKSAGQFPVKVELSSDRHGTLSCVVKDSGSPFVAPDVGLPEKFATHGRGLLLVQTMTGGKLTVDGEKNTASFRYEMNEKLD